MAKELIDYGENRFEKLIRDWENSDQLEGWTDEQISLLNLDMFENFQMQRLKRLNLNDGDIVIRKYVYSKSNIQHEEMTVVASNDPDFFHFKGISFTGIAKFDKVYGVADYGPDYGWIAPK